ncbi:Serine/threonine-protein kinase [Tieghemiomyces parasiticus]|uniref:Serine/threonine-protein kinase n=1 Tax=Tieghemiomyces parasiticus TaxID=78921 RepID=A0A9W7ZJ10_9FUNG|nr:Serine/threonine-protein kinase [Tieghemiomyces parasiticus]
MIGATSGYQYSYSMSSPATPSLRPRQSLADGRRPDSHLATTTTATTTTLATAARGPAISLKRSRRALLRTPLGEYEILRSLGQGSYGKVKLVRNALTQEHMAVKIIKRYPKHKHRKDHPEAKRARTLDQRVLREANLSRFLGEQHPGIIQLRDFRATDTHFYLFYEFIDGITLSERIGRSGLSEGKARQYFKQVVQSVGFCHAHSIIHRDLKLENVMITRHTKAVKLIDFGLANFFDKQSQLATACGSIPYTAPEILRGEKYTGPEVDVWSLGVLLYVMTTGMLPFGDPSVAKNFENIAAGNFWIPGAMSEPLQDLLIRMLDPDVGRRIALESVVIHAWMSPPVVSTGSATATDQVTHGALGLAGLPTTTGITGLTNPSAVLPPLTIANNTLQIAAVLNPQVVAEVATCLFRDVASVQRELEELIERGRFLPTLTQRGPLSPVPTECRLPFAYAVDTKALVEVRNCPVVSLYHLISEQMRKHRWLAAPTSTRLDFDSSFVEGGPRDSLAGLGLGLGSASLSRSILQNLSVDIEDSFTTTTTTQPDTPGQLSCHSQYPRLGDSDHGVQPPRYDLHPADSASVLQRVSSSILHSLHFFKIENRRPSPATAGPAAVPPPQLTEPVGDPVWGRRTEALGGSPLAGRPLPNSVLSGHIGSRPASSVSLVPWPRRADPPTFPAGESRPLLHSPSLTSSRPLAPVLDATQLADMTLRSIGAFEAWSHRITFPRRCNGLTKEQVLGQLVGFLEGSSVVYRYVSTRQPPPSSQSGSSESSGEDPSPTASTHRRSRTHSRQGLLYWVRGRNRSDPRQCKAPKVYRPSLTEVDADPLVRRAIIKRYLLFGSAVIDERKLRRLKALQEKDRRNGRGEPRHRRRERRNRRQVVWRSPDGSKELPGEVSDPTAAEKTAAASILARLRRQALGACLPKATGQSSATKKTTVATATRTSSVDSTLFSGLARRCLVPVDHPSLTLIGQYTPSLGDKESEALERYSCGVHLEVVRVEGPQRWAVVVHRLSGHRVKYQRFRDYLTRMVSTAVAPKVHVEPLVPTRPAPTTVTAVSALLKEIPVPPRRPSHYVPRRVATVARPKLASPAPSSSSSATAITATTNTIGPTDPRTTWATSYRRRLASLRGPRGPPSPPRVPNYETVCFRATRHAHPIGVAEDEPSSVAYPPRYATMPTRIKARPSGPGDRPSAAARV